MEAKGIWKRNNLASYSPESDGGNAKSFTSICKTMASIVYEREEDAIRPSDKFAPIEEDCLCLPQAVNV